MINREVEIGRNDVSFVQPGLEPEIASLISIKNSFFNNLAFSLSRLITATNLILLGHIFYENETNYQLFMIFQIGVFITEILGKIFLFGLLRYLFLDKEGNELYNLYLKMKSALIILILIILIPVSILSYFIIEYILKNNLGINDQSLNKEVYLNFLLFVPFISLFEILFLLNIEYLHKIKKERDERNNYNIKDIFLYIVSFFIAHITASYILLYILEIGLIGLTLSYGVNSFLFYLFTNIYIKKCVQENTENFFTLIPKKELFDVELMNILKENSILSFHNLVDIIFLIIEFIISLFSSKEQIIINIIYLNFYELFCAINKGFHFTLKNYFAKNLEDATKRKKYVIYFSIYCMIFTFAVFIVLILFKNSLLEAYLYKGGNGKIYLSIYLKIIYPLVILITSIRMTLNGILRGMSISAYLFSKVFYILLFIILCLILCYVSNFDISGLWLSLLLINIEFLCESIYKANKYFRHVF